MGDEGRNDGRNGIKAVPYGGKFYGLAVFI